MTFGETFFRARVRRRGAASSSAASIGGDLLLVQRAAVLGALAVDVAQRDLHRRVARLLVDLRGDCATHARTARREWLSFSGTSPGALARSARFAVVSASNCSLASATFSVHGLPEAPRTRSWAMRAADAGLEPDARLVQRRAREVDAAGAHPRGAPRQRGPLAEAPGAAGQEQGTGGQALNANEEGERREKR